MLVLAVLTLLACNLSVSTPPAAQSTLTQKPSPSPQLVVWRGGPTSTPFQPIAPTQPTAFSQPPTLTATPWPTYAIASLHDGPWPPPNSDGPGPTPATQVPPPYPLFSDENSLNFLLLGSDSGSASFRTDTLIIASVQPKAHLVTLISIPRDLFVYIPGWTMNRVNTAYMHGVMVKYPGGGEALLKDTLLYNLGLRIDHIAKVDFEGFENIIDSLGGIDIPLVCAFTDWHIKNPRRSDQDPSNWELYTIGPGIVHMDGDLALWYARSRQRSSDFDRGRRQQEVLRAIYTRSMQLEVILHIPKLYKEVKDAVTTDLSLNDLLNLAPLAGDLGGEHHIRSFYINRDAVTSWRTPYGAAVQLPDHEALQSLLATAMAPPDEIDEKQMGTLIEIRNATSNLDWDALAAQRLHYAGYETRLVPFNQSDHENTKLYTFTSTPDSRRTVDLVRLLGLSNSSLVSVPDQESEIDYRLVLGEDYNPCFDPSKLPD